MICFRFGPAVVLHRLGRFRDLATCGKIRACSPSPLEQAGGCQRFRNRWASIRRLSQNTSGNGEEKPSYKITQNVTGILGSTKRSFLVSDDGSSAIPTELSNAGNEPMKHVGGGSESSAGALKALFPALSGRVPGQLERRIEAFVVHILPKRFQEFPQGYFAYVRWYMLAYVAGSTCMVLSTQSMLYAIGLGAGSIPMAAALNWVIKDGLGQLGGVLFASCINSRFDADPKRWRMVAAVALDSACILEAMTPLAPMLFLPMASHSVDQFQIANMGKNVSWLAASATRANILLSFARRANLADVTAKAGSQVGSDPYVIIPALFGLKMQFLFVRSPLEKSLSMFIFCNAVFLSSMVEEGIVSKSESIVGQYGSNLFTGFESKLPRTLLLDFPIEAALEQATTSKELARRSILNDISQNGVHVFDSAPPSPGQEANGDKSSSESNRSGAVALFIREDATSDQILGGYVSAVAHCLYGEKFLSHIYPSSPEAEGEDDESAKAKELRELYLQHLRVSCKTICGLNLTLKQQEGGQIEEPGGTSQNVQNR
eukprot:jgi/Bigna1/77784/fgenesh1_pg.50_\